MKFILSLIGFLILATLCNAQRFLPNLNHPKTFQEIQLEFSEWKSHHDLKNEKGWKYFKRWEMEMQLHTDGKGNPVDAKTYMEAVTKAANEKSALRSMRSQSSAWTPVGPNVIPDNLTGYLEVGIGRINCIAFHPTDPSTYFVGVAQGGVWKTTNNGQSWTPLTDNLPILRISDIAIDPSNPNTMYIAVGDFEYIGVGLNLNGRKRNTHYGLGIYKTTDGGQTWNPTGLAFQLTGRDGSLMRRTIINPNNTNQLLACGASGMYSSNDGGNSWVQQMDSLFWDLVQDPQNPNVLYAAGGWVENANDGYVAIYKTTNFGSSWTMLNTGIPTTGVVQRLKLAISPSNSNYVYALADDVNDAMYGIYQSTDAGATWNYHNPGLNILDGNDGTDLFYGQGNYDLSLLVNPSDPNTIYTGGINIWGSTDGGQSFNPVSHWTTSYGPTTHADIHFMQIQPLTGNIFVCNDGGVYRTTSIQISTWVDANNGVPWPTQWTNLSNGMQTTSFYRISSSRNLTGRLIAGAQDNSTAYFDGTSWKDIFGGDGMDNYLNPDDDYDIIGSSQFGNFYQSLDGGFSANGLMTNPFGEVAEWTTPIVADYTTPGTLYVGNSNVYQSLDNGMSWNQISYFPMTGLGDNEISALDVSQVNSQNIVAAKRVRYEYSVSGSIHITTDGGFNWSDVTAGVPDSLYYTSISFDAYDQHKLYVSLAGFVAGQKIYASSNSGSTWQNITYNLPNLPVNCVKPIPGGNGSLMAATDIGVYVLDAGTTTWYLESTGLPNVIVTDIEFNEALQKVYISTFGRGVWAMDLSLLLNRQESTEFDSQISVYPTVNKGNFRISLSNEVLKGGTCKMEVTDVTGRLITTKEFSQAGDFSESISAPSGIYYLRFTEAGLSSVKNIIIQ